MKRTVIVLFSGLLALALAGCSNITKQDVGAVTGGVIGGALGSTVGKGHGRTAATIAGTVIGGLIGGAVGKSMDEVDQLKMQQALETNRTNQTTSWENPDNHNSYAVTPTKTYTNTSGEPCRVFTTNATIDGKREVIQGKACRVNGRWVMQN